MLKYSLHVPKVLEDGGYMYIYYNYFKEFANISKVTLFLHVPIQKRNIYD